LSEQLASLPALQPAAEQETQDEDASARKQQSMPACTALAIATVASTCIHGALGVIGHLVMIYSFDALTCFVLLQRCMWT
jgi:hypothetical protein